MNANVEDVRSEWGGEPRHVASGRGQPPDRGRLENVRAIGPARVLDGDTIEVRGVRVRLEGIDAPETMQKCRTKWGRWSCGRRAAEALSKRIGGKVVACEITGRDRYRRSLAVCRLEGTDLNAWMVTEGWALAYRQFTRRYVSHEAAARQAKRGLWRGEFIAPWDWRRGVRLRSTAAETPGEARSRQDPSGGACRIKGNISRAGERIYHVPGGRDYNTTQVETAHGERWFCTERGAREAGWRRSRH